MPPKKKDQRTNAATERKKDEQRLLKVIVALSQEEIHFFEGFCAQYTGMTNNFLQAALARRLKIFYEHNNVQETENMDASSDENNLSNDDVADDEDVEDGDRIDNDQLSEDDIDRNHSDVDTNFDRLHPPQQPIALYSLDDDNAGYETDDSELQDKLGYNDGMAEVDDDNEEDLNSFMHQLHQEQRQQQQQPEEEEQEDERQQRGESSTVPMSIGIDVPLGTLSLETLLLSCYHLLQTFPGGTLVSATQNHTHATLADKFPEDIMKRLSSEEKDKLCIMANRTINVQTGMYEGYNPRTLGEHCAHSLNMISVYGSKHKSQSQIANNVLISHLKVESLKSLILSIADNDKAYAIAVDIIGERLNNDMNRIGAHYDEGMTSFLGVDHGHIKDVISESGKLAFTKCPEISMLFSKLCLSDKLSSQACSFFGGKEIVLSNFQRGEKFFPQHCSSTYSTKNISSSSSESKSASNSAVESGNKRKSTGGHGRQDIQDIHAQALLCGRFNKLYMIVPFILSIILHCANKGSIVFPILIAFGMMLKLNGATNSMIDFCSQLGITHSPRTIMVSLKKTAVMYSSWLKDNMKEVLLSTNLVVLVIYDNYAKLQFNSLMMQGENLTRTVHTLQFLVAALSVAHLLSKAVDRLPPFGTIDEAAIRNAGDFLISGQSLDVPERLNNKEHPDYIHDESEPTLSRFWIYPCLHGLSSSFVYFVSKILPVLKFVFGMKVLKELFMVVDPEPILLILKASWVAAESVSWLALIPPIFHYQKHYCEILLENVAIAMFIFFGFFDYMNFRRKDFKKLKVLLLATMRKGQSNLPAGSIAEIEGEAARGNNSEGNVDNDDDDVDAVDEDSGSTLGGLRPILRGIMLAMSRAEEVRMDEDGEPIAIEIDEAKEDPMSCADQANEAAVDMQPHAATGRMTEEIYQDLKSMLLLITLWINNHLTYLYGKYPSEAPILTAEELEEIKKKRRERAKLLKDNKAKGVKTPRPAKKAQETREKSGLHVAFKKFLHMISILSRGFERAKFAIKENNLDEHNSVNKWLFRTLELISLSTSVFNGILFDGNISKFVRFIPTLVCVLAFAERPNVFRAAMTNLIQILHWLANRPDIILVWGSICKWCNDNFIEDHNACIANSLATKMRLTFQYVQFVVMLLTTKRNFSKSFRSMLGTGEVDEINVTSSFCKKRSKANVATTSKKAEVTLDAEKYTADGSFDKETIKASVWILSQFEMWKDFYELAKNKNEEADLEEVVDVLGKYIPKDIGLALIPCYIRNFLTYRADTIRDHSKGAAESTDCPCEHWIKNQPRGAVLDPLYKYLLAYAKENDPQNARTYKIVKERVKTVDLLKLEMLQLCKVLHNLEYPNVEFNGEAYRLFLINCCAKNNTLQKVVEAELEVAVECPIDINGIYRLAADDGNEDNVINSYYPLPTSFSNLKEPTGR